jgi:hypothetical protein
MKMNKSTPLLFLGLVLVSTPVMAQKAKSEKPTLILMDLQARNTDPDTAALVTASLGVSFEKTGVFQVRTASDVRGAMDLEAEKSAMGCDTDSCLAEIAGAMGASYVAHGTVGSLGKTTLVTVSLYHHAKAKSLGRQRVQVEDRGKLPQVMDEMVKELVADIELVALAPDLKQEPTLPEEDPAFIPGQEDQEASAFSSPLFWAGAGIFGLGAAGATGLGIGAGLLHEKVADAGADGGERASAQGTGELLVIGAAASGALALVGAGVAAIPMVME